MWCILSTLNVLQTANYDRLKKFNYIPLPVDSFKQIDSDAITDIFYWLPILGCINISGFCKLLVILLMYASQSLSQSKETPFFNKSNNRTDDCAKLGLNFLRKAAILNLDLTLAVHESVLKLMLVTWLFWGFFSTLIYNMSWESHSRKSPLGFL